MDEEQRPLVNADTALVKTAWDLASKYSDPIVFTRTELTQVFLTGIFAGANLMYVSPEWMLAAIHEAGAEAEQEFYKALEQNRRWVARLPLYSNDARPGPGPEEEE